MIQSVLALISSVIGNQSIGRVLLLGIEWFLEKNKTDKESRELAVSLAMSLRRQGVTDVIMSYNSDRDGDLAVEEWERIEKEGKLKAYSNTATALPNEDKNFITIERS